MEINWVTVAAQAVNFLLLVWLLNKFLYGPVTRAMSAREQGIRQRLEDAERAKQNAEEKAQNLQSERDDLRQQKEELLIAAREHADALRRTLEETARNDIETQRGQWLKLLESEKEEFLADFQQRAATEFFALAQAGLIELAGEPLEKNIIAKFIEKTAALSGDDKLKLQEAARVEGLRGEIQSNFTMAPDDRAKVEHAVDCLIGKAVAIDFNQNNELVAGIRLRIGGQTIEWSIAHYLHAMQERLESAIPTNSSAKNQRAAE